MKLGVSHIDVCICTFRRPALLGRLLNSLRGLSTGGRFTYSIVVADNDREESARTVVSQFAASGEVRTVYCVEPIQSFALVRNRALSQGCGEFVAFIDDDEFPIKEWLLRLFTTCEQHDADGALGPVLEHFDEEPPAWFRKGRFYDFRLRQPTGHKLEWRHCRTGNVLIRRSVLEKLVEPFRTEFRTGGEDVDFFHRLINAGGVFVWCDEAEVYETVLSHRWQRKFLIRRALLNGSNSWKNRRNRVYNTLKSALAFGVYCLALPVFFILGQHYFMRYLVKLADHTGRLLACARLNPVRERPM